MSRSEHDRRIDYLELPAIDIPGTKAFYSAVFGWNFTDHGPAYTSFDDGRLSGGFTRDRAVAHGNGPLVVLYAADLEMAQVHVTENGGRVTRGIFSFPNSEVWQRTCLGNCPSRFSSSQIGDLTAFGSVCSSIKILSHHMLMWLTGSLQSL